LCAIVRSRRSSVRSGGAADHATAYGSAARGGAGARARRLGLLRRKGVPIKPAVRTPTPTPPDPYAAAETAAQTEAEAGDPLTGIGAPPKGPGLAVKIDNARDARPSRADAADVIYVEQAEGGLTRLVAVFASYKPRRSRRCAACELRPRLLAQ